MNQLEIRIGKQRHSFSGPSDWADLSQKQFLQYMNWRTRLSGDPAGRFVLLRLWYRLRTNRLWLLADEQRLEIVELLNFLDARPERWMLPRIRLNYRHYVGPGDELELLSFGEFMHAFSARSRLLSADSEQPSRKDMAALAAALYRPRAAWYQKKTEGHRRLFDEVGFDQQCRRFEQLPESVLRGIWFNFEGCLDALPARFTHLFGGTKSAGDGTVSTWLDVGLTLARQTGALGTFHQIEATNVYLVFPTLDALMAEAEQLRKQTENG